MGLEVDTSRTFEYVFEDDRAKPKKEQRALTVRYLSARTHAKFVELMGETYQTDTIGGFNDKVKEGLALCVVGCRNLLTEDGKPFSFSVGELDAALTQGDILELKENLSVAMLASNREKKASALQSLVTTEKSA